ncbi:WhiB family transcriptional regulator [Acidothermaceae bacterium B102]|nr:WhiB family transcriptional regulator [Acidothermaceae bacterium B102]
MTVRPGTHSTDWRDLARCRDLDPELFFPIGSSGPAVAQTQQAVRVCHQCTVTEACLTFALEQHQDAGVWGGTTEEQRRSLIRVRSRERVT